MKSVHWLSTKNLLHCFKFSFGADIPPHIAIIGSGITGLTAAYELSKQGYRVTLYEQSDALGGLASGFATHGTYLERIYHCLFPSDKDVVDLIKELNIENHLMWLQSSVGVYVEGALLPFSSPKDLLFFKPLSLWQRIRLGMVMLYLKRVKNWQKFIHCTAEQWVATMVWIQGVPCCMGAITSW